ncbi:hypothetical protein GCM10011349_47800 [Novosphingobium indicum]|uniref:Integrase catalytic domain-containing protein n=1 Tax=Novosphingobium indicum TaxID=462949 RepID=A0ABQ2K3H4_9SPHN|nr:hypothetical protein GCM10011349_47800 [Novosphingobium indicum]
MVLPDGPNQRWSLDFVSDTFACSRRFRILCVVDDYTRECLAIHVQRKLKSDDVLAVLTELFQRHGPPDHIRSDNVLGREAAAENSQKVSLRRSRSALMWF